VSGWRRPSRNGYVSFTVERDVGEGRRGALEVDVVSSCLEKVAHSWLWWQSWRSRCARINSMIVVVGTLPFNLFLMPINIPGLLVPFQLLFNPRLVLPSIVVKGMPLFSPNIPYRISGTCSHSKIFAMLTLRHYGKLVIEGLSLTKITVSYVAPSSLFQWFA
jgi:hypothetical protein